MNLQAYRRRIIAAPFQANPQAAKALESEIGLAMWAQRIAEEKQQKAAEVAVTFSPREQRILDYLDTVQDATTADISRALVMNPSNITDCLNCIQGKSPGEVRLNSKWKIQIWSRVQRAEAAE
jgi:hypothetical protein